MSGKGQEDSATLVVERFTHYVAQVFRPAKFSRTKVLRYVSYSRTKVLCYVSWQSKLCHYFAIRFIIKEIAAKMKITTPKLIMLNSKRENLTRLERGAG